MNSTWWLQSGDLDDDQKRVVSLPPGGKYLVLGPPGSGKTNLFLLRASFMIRSGLPNVLVVSFSRTLRNFMASGAGLYQLTPEKLVPFPVGEFRDGGWILGKKEERGLTFVPART
jgi:hypothetical protein